MATTPASKINRTSFFDKARTGLFGGKLTQGQVEGMTAILNEWDRRCIPDLRFLAYMLSTTFHETARTMQAIEEYGKGKGKPYGSKIKMSGKRYLKPDKVYFGRGYVQLTWYENYDQMGKLLGIDLLNHPERALEPFVATAIMFEGMLKGMFTGRKLSDYFNDKTEDWINARKIINGLDKAALIAGYGKKFYSYL